MRHRHAGSEKEALSELERLFERDELNKIVPRDLDFFKHAFEPSAETMRKIRKIKALLLLGLKPSKAVREVGLGWKNYYKYLAHIYDIVPISLSSEYVRDYEFRGLPVKHMQILLDYPAKLIAARKIREKFVKENLSVDMKIGRKWFELSKSLKMKWIDEFFWKTSEVLSVPQGRLIHEFRGVSLRDAGYAWLFVLRSIDQKPISLKQSSTKEAIIEIFWGRIRPDDEDSVFALTIQKAYFGTGFDDMDALNMAALLSLFPLRFLNELKTSVPKALSIDFSELHRSED